jgi:tetratricopeptide (TPR) repeat protein
VELERGIGTGERAARLAPDRPEGRFWLAANLGALAESSGAVQALEYRGRIKSELQRVMAIAPSWQAGSAEAALGRWYDKVPRLFGGSDKTAESYFRRALTVDPESRTALTDLADLLIDHGRVDEARALLQRAIDAPIDPDWAPEDRELRAQAAARLQRLEQ